MFCFFSDYHDLIVNGNLDAVYIPLPNSLHFRWAELALKHNINVLVEKPLATKLSEAQKLTTIARKNELILFETFQFRFNNKLSNIN